MTTLPIKPTTAAGRETLTLTLQVTRTTAVGSSIVDAEVKNWEALQITDGVGFRDDALNLRVRRKDALQPASTASGRTASDEVAPNAAITYRARKYRVVKVAEDGVNGQITLEAKLQYNSGNVLEAVRGILANRLLFPRLTPGSTEPAKGAAYLNRWTDLLVRPPNAAEQVSGSVELIAYRLRRSLRFAELLASRLDSDTPPTLQQLSDLLNANGLQLHFTFNANTAAPYAAAPLALGFGFVAIVPIGWTRGDDKTLPPFPISRGYNWQRNAALIGDGLLTRPLAFTIPEPETAAGVTRIRDYMGGDDGVLAAEDLGEYDTPHEGVIALEAQRLRDAYLGAASMQVDVPLDFSWQVHDGVDAGANSGLPYRNWYVREIRHNLGARALTTTLYLNARPTFTLGEVIAQSPPPFNVVDLMNVLRWDETPPAPVISFRESDPDINGETELMIYGGWAAVDVAQPEQGRPIIDYEITLATAGSAQNVVVLPERGESLSRPAGGVTAIFNDLLADSEYQITARARNKFGFGGVSNTLTIMERMGEQSKPSIAADAITALPKAQQSPLTAALQDGNISGKLADALKETIEKQGDDIPDTGRDLTFDVASTAIISLTSLATLGAAVGLATAAGAIGTASAATSLAGISVGLGGAVLFKVKVLSAASIIKAAAGIKAFTAVSGGALVKAGGVAFVHTSLTTSALGTVLITPAVATGIGAVVVVGIVAGSYFVSRAVFSPSDHGIIYIVQGDGRGSPLDDDLIIAKRTTRTGNWSGAGIGSSIGVSGAFQGVIDSNELETQKTWVVFEPLDVGDVGQRQYAFAVKKRGVSGDWPPSPDSFGRTASNDFSDWRVGAVLNEADFTRVWFDDAANVLHSPTFPLRWFGTGGAWPS